MSINRNKWPFLGHLFFKQKTTMNLLIHTNVFCIHILRYGNTYKPVVNQSFVKFTLIVAIS